MTQYIHVAPFIFQRKKPDKLAQHSSGETPGLQKETHLQKNKRKNRKKRERIDEDTLGPPSQEKESSQWTATSRDKTRIEEEGEEATWQGSLVIQRDAEGKAKETAPSKKKTIRHVEGRRGPTLAW